MIEARFTTAANQGRRDRFEICIKGRTPKMLHNGCAPSGLLDA